MRSPAVLVATATALFSCWTSACVGTESGNPPFAAENLIRIEAVNGQLLVTGDPGAITPADSSVELFILTTASHRCRPASPPTDHLSKPWMGQDPTRCD